MTDSWASYENGEEEVIDFIERIGGTAGNWIECVSAKWSIEYERVQFLFFPKSKKKLVLTGEQTSTYNGRKV